MKHLLTISAFPMIGVFFFMATACGDKAGDAYHDSTRNTYGTNGSRNSISPSTDSARDSSQRGKTVSPEQRSR